MQGDLRTTKTQKAISASLNMLLESQSFQKITVRDICAKALISRATFYAHFDDKYALLKSWLKDFRPEGIDQGDTYEKTGALFNAFVYRNKAKIRNLISNADGETLEILHQAIACALYAPGGGQKKDNRRVVASNFYAGGMFNCILWQVNNQFPPDAPPMNEQLYEIIQIFKKWE